MTSSRKDAYPDRKDAVPKLIGDPADFLIVTGLGGPAKDVSALTGGAPNVFALAGAMGAASMMGLGLALARPDRKVLVVTGDGELLMNVGALATIAVLNPPNLAILCVDNGHYGETGYQKSHTSLGADLAAMAAGAGIAETRMVTGEAGIAEARRLLRAANGTRFVCLKVGKEPPPQVHRPLDAAWTRTRFREALLGRP